MLLAALAATAAFAAQGSTPAPAAPAAVAQGSTPAPAAPAAVAQASSPAVAPAFATPARAAQDTSRVIEVHDSGRIVRVGAFRPRQYLGDENFPGGVTPLRRNAIRAYGRPDGKSPQGCPNKWKALGVRMVVADFGGGPLCAPGTAIQQLVITGRTWRTERGLKIGDSLDRVRELYPELQRFSELYDLDARLYRYTWGLVFEPSRVGGPPNLIDRLSAEIRGRKVRSLTVSPYGAGD